MEKAIDILDGVSVTIEGRTVKMVGPKGSLSRNFDDPRFNDLISMEKKSSTITVRCKKDTRRQKAICGTFASHIRNMVKGAAYGYKYEMQIVYKHFPMTVTINKNIVEIRNFLGEKDARKARIIGNTEVKADKEKVVVTGASIEEAGLTASNIETACKLTRRDRRIFQDGIYITSRGIQRE